MNAIRLRLACGRLLLALVVLLALSGAYAQPVTTAGSVKLVPVMERIDLVTDVAAVNGMIYATTQPGLLLRKSLSGGDVSVFLDVSARVGKLGTGIPSLPGLGYPVAGTYDERGLLGFAPAPGFDGKNGRFWIWYTNINESNNPTNFFHWLDSTSDAWDQSRYDHVGYIDEYRMVGGKPVLQRTVLRIKRPYFNHTGFSSLVWSPELNTLVIGLGDGGSEYDPNNIAQDDNQLSGKLLKIDLAALGSRDLGKSPPVATFSDLRALNVPADAFTPLLKGLRNPSKVTWEQVDPEEDGPSLFGNRFIKYLANTGQDTIEFIHAFDSYGLNFGFRPWEGIFPTSFEIDVPSSPGQVPVNDGRVLSYGLEASNLNAQVYRPFVHYTHLDEVLGPNANTGSTLYRGEIVFTDWISFIPRGPLDVKAGLLMHATPNRNALQQPVAVKQFVVDFSAVNFIATPKGRVLFYTAINTDPARKHLYVGAFKDVQFITNQANNALGSAGLGGGIYEVVSQ